MDTIDIQGLPDMPDFQDTTSSVAAATDSSIASTQAEYGLSYKFDFDRNEFVLKDGKLVELSTLEAIKQWITLCLKTQFEEFKSYYFTNFGVDTGTLFGLKKRDYKIGRVEEEISNALTQNTYITAVSNFSEKYNKNIVTINFDVYLKDGTTINNETYSFTT